MHFHVDEPPQTNLQLGFVMLLSFIHVFLIAVIIGSVEGFMSHLNHESEQVGGLSHLLFFFFPTVRVSLP